MVFHHFIDPISNVPWARHLKLSQQGRAVPCFVVHTGAIPKAPVFSFSGSLECGAYATHGVLRRTDTIT